MRFESWVNFQNALLLTFSIYAKNSRFPKSIFTTCAIDVQYSLAQVMKCFDCVKTYNLFLILDLFPDRTSDTCKILSSRLNRILWSHRWWKVVPSQKFVNVIIRNWRNIQLYQVSQILLASSSGLMGVSCLEDPLFVSWWFHYFFLSFFLGLRRPNLITGLSGWRTPD